MNTQELLGLNTKWYRYQRKMTQEQFAEKTKFKMAYISLIECGHANPTCSNIDVISFALGVEVIDLFNKQTANKAKKLPARVDQYNRR
ncbi:MAG: helix-turn-helix transcriptional regulator [Bacilli bacterium]|nr:helix-turn-helix transcriptional regulator [Bacilli bacterium]